MKKYYDFINVDHCSNCMILIKIQSTTAQTRLRISSLATLTVVESIPTIIWLKANETISLKTYSVNHSQGKLLKLSGNVTVSINNTEIIPFVNGWLYHTNLSVNLTIINITLKG